MSFNLIKYNYIHQIYLTENNNPNCMRQKLKKMKPFYINMELIKDNGLSSLNKFLSKSVFFAQEKPSHYLIRMISLVTHNKQNGKVKTQKKLWNFGSQIYIMKRNWVNSFILP